VEETLDMDKSGQREFIDRVKNALGHAADNLDRKGKFFDLPMSEKDRTILKGIENRTPQEKERLLETMIEAAQPINLNVIVLPDVSSVTSAIVDLVREKEPEWGDKKSVAAWKHPLIASLNLAQALSEQDVAVYFTDAEDGDREDDLSVVTREKLRQHIIDAYVGITSADFCMADTATLVMRTRPGQARSVSLLPLIHIAVIKRDQIIADLKELYALLKWDPEHQREGLTNCMTFISGPSKTADIEATMVHGAHGPREVYIFVITG
jgi:L-lactate dehydrogenase complex protein LldG